MPFPCAPGPPVCPRPAAQLGISWDLPASSFASVSSLVLCLLNPVLSSFLGYCLFVGDRLSQLLPGLRYMADKVLRRWMLENMLILPFPFGCQFDFIENIQLNSISPPFEGFLSSLLTFQIVLKKKQWDSDSRSWVCLFLFLLFSL